MTFLFTKMYFDTKLCNKDGLIFKCGLKRLVKIRVL